MAEAPPALHAHVRQDQHHTADTALSAYLEASQHPYISAMLSASLSWLRKLMTKRELWLEEFRTTAYKDQTGVEHSGYVIYDRITVADTGERFDVDDGYKKHASHGRIYANVDNPNERFEIHTETVDYSGGTYVKPLFPQPERKARWKPAHYNKQRCVNPDGSPLA